MHSSQAVALIELVCDFSLAGFDVLFHSSCFSQPTEIEPAR